MLAVVALVGLEAAFADQQPALSVHRQPEAVHAVEIGHHVGLADQRDAHAGGPKIIAQRPFADRQRHEAVEQDLGLGARRQRGEQLRAGEGGGERGSGVSGHHGRTSLSLSDGPAQGATAPRIPVTGHLSPVIIHAVGIFPPTCANGDISMVR